MGVQRSTNTKCEDTNIAFRARKAQVHLANTPCLLFLNLTLCYSCLYIKLIGVVWHRSCNKINLPVYPY
jgi:hypothetical protein